MGDCPRHRNPLICHHRSTRPNLQSGMAAYCLDAIVQNQDLMNARERIRSNRDEGESVSEKLKSIKKMKAARMFLLGKTKLGEDIRDSVQANYDKHVHTAATKAVEAAAAYRITVANYDSVFAEESNPKSWNVDQLKKVLKALKQKDDTAMPKHKVGLYTRYLEWQGRRPLPVEDVGEEAAPLEDGSSALAEEAEDDINEETEDCIAAMILLNGSSTETQQYIDSTV